MPVQAYERAPGEASQKKDLSEKKENVHVGLRAGGTVPVREEPIVRRRVNYDIGQRSEGGGAR